MAIFGNGMKLGGPIAVGAGIVILAPIIVPVLAGAFKPIAKAAIKGGMIAYGKAKEAAAETAETLEDIAAEAKAELAETTGTKTSKPKKSAAASK